MFDKDLFDKDLFDDDFFDKEIFNREIFDKEIFNKDFFDKEVIDKEVIDKEVINKEVINKEVINKKVDDKKVDNKKIHNECLSDGEIIEKIRTNEKAEYIKINNKITKINDIVEFGINTIKNKIISSIKYHCNKLNLTKSLNNIFDYFYLLSSSNFWHYIILVKKNINIKTNNDVYFYQYRYYVDGEKNLLNIIIQINDDVDFEDSNLNLKLSKIKNINIIENYIINDMLSKFKQIDFFLDFIEAINYFNNLCNIKQKRTRREFCYEDTNDDSSNKHYKI